MSFSNFTLQINEPNFPNFISFQIEIKYGCVLASMKTECLVVDFVNFLNHLQKMHKIGEKKISFIQTIEKNIEINLDLNEFGNIGIQVFFCNFVDNIILQFKYEIDQSFLPELIKEINAVINND